MDISYKKSNNTSLFKNFSDKTLLNASNAQNYIPIYNKYFNLNENNYNGINLNNKNSLHEINKKMNENQFNGKIIDEDNHILEKKIFFKLSPLIDPYKYLGGKYDLSDSSLFNLPKFNSSDLNPKIIDGNNSSYVDGFFTYLTSQLFNRYDFIHGLDYYGSYLATKNNYIIDIADDLDYLSNNDSFYNNNNKLFHFIDDKYEDIINENSRKNKKKIKISATPINKYDDDINDIDILEIQELLEKSDLTTDQTCDNTDYNDYVILETNLKKHDDKFPIHSRTNSSKSSSHCSSRSSNTDPEKDDADQSSEETTDELASEESMDDYSILVSLNSFPVQLIALESCENTLDSLLEDDLVGEEELSCIVVQILMMLITYQKLFNLTHNDLHTNNIMYIKTEKTFLSYKVNNRHYKIKTYGKIFKIIDFGRAIYKYKNELICSDDFDITGDAATQYNFEPFYNKNKPIIEPNYSFDLCRLGCSIYDFISEKYDDIDEITSPIHMIIMNWCNDDNNNNILYKNTGLERYPDFKLYKMIARKVHNHIPVNELKNKYFDKYVVSRKMIKKGSNIWNLDKLDEISMDPENIQKMNSLEIDSEHLACNKKLSKHEKKIKQIMER